LRTAEEAAKVKALEFEEFQTMKDLEIQSMPEGWRSLRRRCGTVE
jgi:hypothetical protein